MMSGSIVKCIALLLGLAALAFAAAPGCAVKDKLTGDSTPPPDRTVTILVWDPFDETERPITFVADWSAPDEVKRAVKELQNEDYEVARQSLVAAVERVPNNAQAHFLLGLVNEYLGNWDDAVNAFKQSNILKSTKAAQEGRARSAAKRGDGAEE